MTTMLELKENVNVSKEMHAKPREDELETA